MARVEALAAEGMSLYKRGAYSDALARFKQAFRIYPLSNLLYNMARCYQALGRLEAAIIYYERCAEHAQTPMQTRERARKNAARLKRTQAQVDADVRRKQDLRQNAVISAPAAPAKKSKALRLGKWVTAGSALTSLVAATVLFSLGNSDNGTLKDAKSEAERQGKAPLTYSSAKELQDSANSKFTIGYVFLGTSVALAATSAFFFFLDRPSSSEASGNQANTTSARLDLAPTPGGLSATVNGRF